MLIAFGDLDAVQSTSIKHTTNALKKVLNYATTKPNTKITYHKSDMMLYIDSDALYLPVSKCRSPASGFYYLSDKIGTPLLLQQKSPPLNGPIYVLSKIMRNIVASAAESKLGALFLDRQKAVPICTVIIELGHPQPLTPIRTENLATCGTVNGKVRKNKSRSMDETFWIRNRVNQGQFLVYW